jgi:hypothetical protein
MLFLFSCLGISLHPELIRHPPRNACLGISRRGIEGLMAPAALPDQAALVQKQDQQTRRVAVSNPHGPILSEPSPQVWVCGWLDWLADLAAHGFTLNARKY